MSDFMKTMYVNGPALAVWISLLLLVNMVAPLIYVGTLEGQLVLAAGMVGAVIQMAVFNKLGFVRLLGVGHILWVPLVPWLWTRLDGFPSGDLFTLWLTAVVVLDGISLVIDVRDVGRYIGGDRTPHLSDS